MSANKNQPVELTGKVVLKKVAPGSKSEHEAVWLETEKGTFLLRLVGGNPFHDPVLHKLKGKTITAKGILEQTTFFAKDVTEHSD